MTCTVGPPFYVTTALHLRRQLKSFGIDRSSEFPLHSCKTTLLSWAGFLQLEAHIMRKMQGRHKTDCADLYSKEDVTPALRLQVTVMKALLSGWRPCLAQCRGAAAPLVEPVCEVTLAKFNPSEYSF